MSKQIENVEPHKSAIQDLLDKRGGGDLARKQYDLLVEKTQNPVTKSLPGKFQMGPQSKTREKFEELYSFIRKIQGDSCAEMQEFDSLLTSYQIWQSAEQIQQKPSKSGEGSFKRKKRPGSHKRLSMTVRESKAWPPPHDWPVNNSTQQSDEIQKLKHENELLSIKVDEMTTRLSKIASDKLTDGNPNFANLSDKNRPTKIGEKFGQMYDDEWSEAFDEIKRTSKKEDAEVYEILLNIVLAGQKFCQEVSETQLTSIERGMSEPMLRPMWLSGEKEYSVEELEANASFTASLKKSAKEFRRGAALASVLPLCTIFKDAKFKDICSYDVYKMESLSLYIDACIECLWLMSVQDPPMHITCLRKGDNYEPAHYGMFLTRGKAVEYTVWPAVFLYKNGPLVSKGYVKLK